MNDEKMATSMENQTDAGGGNPLPQAHEGEDPASFALGDTSTATVPDRTDTDDASVTSTECAPTQKESESAQDHLPVCDPLQDPDSDSDTAAALSAQEQLILLQNDLKQMRDELAALREVREGFRRMTDELREFHTLFPEVSLSQIPDEVYEGMYTGIPPAAGYALYLKREREKQREAERVNSVNRQRSSGNLTGADADYFSPAEVRAMTPSEVRQNYQKIMLSMQKWH